MSEKKLKRDAKKYYIAYHIALDNLSCGKALGEHISPEALKNKIAFNKTMDKLSIIDPNCPAKRL